MLNEMEVMHTQSINLLTRQKEESQQRFELYGSIPAQILEAEQTCAVYSSV
jgi:hypothetical protein